MVRPKSRSCFDAFILFLFLFFLPGFLNGDTAIPEKEQDTDKEIIISIENLQVIEFVDLFERIFDIRIVGLDSMYDRTVSLDISGNIPSVIKKCLNN